MGSSWPWSYGSWIFNYLYSQCLSSLMLWVWIPLMVRYTQYNIMRWSLSVVFSGFLHQLNRPPRYNWNIVESGVKHHNPNPILILACTSPADWTWLNLTSQARTSISVVICHDLLQVQQFEVREVHFIVTCVGGIADHDITMETFSS